MEKYFNLKTLIILIITIILIIVLIGFGVIVHDIHQIAKDIDSLEFMYSLENNL